MDLTSHKIEVKIPSSSWLTLRVKFKFEKDVNIPKKSNGNDSKVLENIKDNKCKTRKGNKEYLMSHTNIKLNNRTKYSWV